MPEGDVEIIRRSTEALNRGDIEAVVETFDPDVTFEPRRTSIQGAYSGHAGVREWWTDTTESFAEFRLELEEIREIGEARLLVFGTLHVRGQGSGVEADIPSAAVIRVREGRIAEFKDYGDRGQAMQAAGLAE